MVGINCVYWGYRAPKHGWWIFRNYHKRTRKSFVYDLFFGAWNINLSSNSGNVRTTSQDITTYVVCPSKSQKFGDVIVQTNIFHATVWSVVSKLMFIEGKLNVHWRKLQKNDINTQTCECMCVIILFVTYHLLFLFPSIPISFHSYSIPFLFYSHAIPFPFNSHSIPIPSPFHSHFYSISIPFSFRSHSFPFHFHSIPILFPSHRPLPTLPFPTSSLPNSNSHSLPVPNSHSHSLPIPFSSFLFPLPFPFSFISLPIPFPSFSHSHRPTSWVPVTFSFLH